MRNLVWLVGCVLVAFLGVAACSDDPEDPSNNAANNANDTGDGDTGGDAGDAGDSGGEDAGDGGGEDAGDGGGEDAGDGGGDGGDGGDGGRVDQLPGSGAGDLNGDDVSDLVVVGRGSLRLYFGGDDLLERTSGAADVDLSGDEEMGESATFCDVDNDGNNDLVVTGREINKFYVYLGSTLASTWTSPDVTVEFADESAVSRIQSARCGDVTGDGIDDVVVYGSATFGLRVVAGSATFADSPTMDAQAMTVLADQVGTWALGDINGDGVSDIVARTIDSLGYETGVAVIFGGADIDGKGFDDVDVVFGDVVDGWIESGDVDQDGFDDILVGDVETVHIMRGAADLSGTVSGTDRSFDFPVDTGSSFSPYSGVNGLAVDAAGNIMLRAWQTATGTKSTLVVLKDVFGETPLQCGMTVAYGIDPYNIGTGGNFTGAMEHATLCTRSGSQGPSIQGVVTDDESCVALPEDAIAVDPDGATEWGLSLSPVTAPGNYNCRSAASWR